MFFDNAPGKSDIFRPNLSFKGMNPIEMLYSIPITMGKRWDCLWFWVAIPVVVLGAVLGMALGTSRKSEPPATRRSVLKEATSASSPNDGAASTFLRWNPMGQKLDGLTVEDEFGWSLALSHNGKIMVVGSPMYHDSRDHRENIDTGQVRVFQYKSSKEDETATKQRQQQQQLQQGWEPLGAPIPGEVDAGWFGYSVAISGDGNIIAATAIFDSARSAPSSLQYSGHVRVFQFHRGSNEWKQLGQSLDGEHCGDRFGWSVALSEDGHVVASGSYRNSNYDTNNDSEGDNSDSGHVRVFAYNTESEQWNQMGQDILGHANDQLGVSVSLSADGLTVVAGAPGNEQDSGHIRVFTYEQNIQQWRQLGAALSGQKEGDQFGWSVSCSADGRTVAAGAIEADDFSGSGYLRVFHFNDITTKWEQVGQDLIGEQAVDWIGWDVALSSTGNVVATDAILNYGNGFDSGHVRVFRYNDITKLWEKYGQDLNGKDDNDDLGHSLDLSADGTILASGVRHTNVENQFNDSGHVRVFQILDQSGL